MASTRFTVKHEPITGDIDVLFDFVKRSDTGPYKCKAVNEYGWDETQSRLFILDVPNVDQRPMVDPQAFVSLEKVPEPVNYDKPDEAAKGRPPKWIVHLPKDLKMNDGDQIHMKGKVDGYPAPKVLLFSLFVGFFEKQASKLIPSEMSVDLDQRQQTVHGLDQVHC